MSYERIEESTGVPADILERSAEARAEADGKTGAQVVGDWVGEEAPEAAPAEGATEVSETAAAPDTSGLPPVDSLAGEALVAAAAEAKGIPLALVERSAQARADADGVPVEQVMRLWVVEAGLAAAAGAVAAPPPALEEVAPEPAPAPAEPADPVEPAAAVEPEELSVEVLEPTEPIEAAPTEEEEVVAARGAYPAWLAAALVIIPLIAVMYVLVVPNQPSCGSAGQVGVDPATGEHANCDGSEYGEGEASNVLLGAAIYTASCAVCHGDAGQGAAGPALAGGSVLATFPEGSCDTHIEWVTLGSVGWPEDSYGAQNKPIQGGMPPAALTLTEDEIRQVTLYERVALGGQDEAAGEEDCGFLTDEEEA